MGTQVIVVFFFWGGGGGGGKICSKKKNSSSGECPFQSSYDHVSGPFELPTLKYFTKLCTVMLLNLFL